MSYQPPPPPPPGGYGQPPYGGMPPQQPTTPPLAIVSLVLGILGVFPCCAILVFGIAAVVTGHLAKRDIAASQGYKKGAGLAQAGFILGIVGIVLGIVWWVLTAFGSMDTSFTTNVG
ncbi:conserved hypothetical protein [metagenome]|uniref:DUF4190 domain-containing protein n=1 Tax=metagenome TaxID=256318 RepID=A0A2P2BWD2_9ZZZZ